MPASTRAVRARLRAQRKARLRHLDTAVHEIDNSMLALHAAASAITAGLNAHMLDADGVYQLLTCVFDRQAHALAALRVATQAMGGEA